MSQLKEFGTGPESVIFDLDDVKGYSAIEANQTPQGPDGSAPASYTVDIHLTGTIFTVTFQNKADIIALEDDVVQNFNARVKKPFPFLTELTFDPSAVTVIGPVSVQPVEANGNGSTQEFISSFEVQLAGTTATLSATGPKNLGYMLREKVVTAVTQAGQPVPA